MMSQITGVLLEARGPLTSRDIAEALSVKQKTVGSAMHYLEQARVVSRVGLVPRGLGRTAVLWGLDSEKHRVQSAA